VVLTHFVAAVYPHGVSGGAEPLHGGWEKVLLYPPFGLLVAGHFAVCLFFLLSSFKAGAAELGRLIRNHWSVENQCHHLLDVTYHEDHCPVCDKTAAHNLTLLRELSAKVLRNSKIKGSIRSKPWTPLSGPRSLLPFSTVLVRKPWPSWAGHRR
jgi:hypothetical protein